ncbi:hypothetical protein [Actinophytocola xanthii]|nr:hypothetical protein [Actinophytocola xanthii]
MIAVGFWALPALPVTVDRSETNQAPTGWTTTGMANGIIVVKLEAMETRG